MMKGKSWNLQGMESIENSMDPITKMRNMKIPREKEKPKQPVIIPRITRLPAWFEPTRRNQAEEMEVMMKNNICKKL
jgi:hypothetical protein